ncbi:hypothetical protein [Micromonospora parathelypteridis]|uniref:Uncharacterized protein n=1 Tax=Micromonospora parathelypteridis TaxID=1839617 RepID=A0A840VHI0_9ACTN|nr:hypothetical protein [Micromonospora parathelypteridis]MBB5476312.1 hypothetical protein [Micromonospora parathelypteridis]GGO14554.1 hypothetical protein GCM10011576_25630 [Micromonospora parathelypteridis]
MDYRFLGTIFAAWPFEADLEEYGMVTMRWVTGAVMLACTGALVACGGGADKTPGAAAATPTPSGTPSGTVGTPSAVATDPLLSGKREVTIVRVQGSGSELELSGRLEEGGDTGGRVLFVPMPIGGDRYVIKAFGTKDGHPANDDPSCWQVNGLDIEPELTIEAAVCDEDNPIQRFTIVTKGDGSYAIGSETRTLQHAAGNGLILKEAGDAAPSSTFRFVDKGPADRQPVN